MSDFIQPPGSSDASTHKRRPRYRGKHPRRFEEKYKEHQPEQYPVTVVNVRAAGKSPAGTLRPCTPTEIMDALKPRSGDLAGDATRGYVGHSEELLKKVLSGGPVLVLHADPEELLKTE